MTADNPSPLGEGLVYEDAVPLRVSEIEADVADARVTAIQESNEEILRVIAALDEHHMEGGDEESQYLGQDLARIESKLDLLLDMVAHMLASQLAVPSQLPIRMTARAIQWRQAEAPPATGRQVLLDLYLHRKFPRPLVLLGVVQDVRREHGDFLVTVSFMHMSESVQNWLEKLIFRHHRRSVAHARRLQSEEEAGG
ncbi:MAG: PilZ domain-containing protein [Gammaproteobacteria bacterium]